MNEGRAVTENDSPAAVATANQARSTGSQQSSTAPNQQPLTKQQRRKERRKRRKERQRQERTNANAIGQPTGPKPNQANVNRTGQPTSQKPHQPNTSQQPPLAILRPQIQQRQLLAIQNVRVTPRPYVKFSQFANLPIEIQRRIFEIAYFQTLLCKGPPNDWVYISCQVRQWIDPFIYESIVLPEDYQRNSYKRLHLYERTFRSKAKEFYAKTVQSIFTNRASGDRGYSSKFEVELLSVCDNITNLECWSSPCEELSALLKTKHYPKLTTLCVNIDLLPKDESTFRLPIFQHVTHLDITSDEPQIPSWESLHSMTNLTHMRVYLLVKTKDFREAMDQTYAIAVEAQKFFPSNLKYFVVIVPGDLLCRIANIEQPEEEESPRWEHMESVRLGTFDPRIVMGCCGDEELYEEQMLEVEEWGKLEDYLQIVAPLEYPNWPRVDLPDEEKDTWLEVVARDRRRQRMRPT